MKSLNPSSKIVRNQELISTDMAGDTVMMDIEQGKYFGLSGVGPFLWEELSEPSTIGDLSRKVFEKFDVDKETCDADVVSFAEGLIESNVVVLVDK